MRETQITISDYFKSRMFATIQVTLCEINTFTLLLFVWVFRMPLANSTAFCLESSVPADSSQLKPLSLIFIMWEWRDSNPLNRKATDLQSVPTHHRWRTPKRCLRESKITLPLSTNIILHYI